MPLSLTQANKILSNYNIGKAKSIKRLTSGHANENYKITTKKGNYVLRICKEKPLKDIKYKINILNKLKRFPAPKLFQRKDGKYINQTKYGNILIYQYVEGKEPKPNKQIVKEIAKAVAKLNSFKNWKQFEKENALSFDNCKKIIKKFDKAKYKYPKLFEFVKQETCFLEKPLKQKLPKGLIHADVFTDNTKFKGNKLIAILDYEEICTDTLLFDVGATINGFCFKNNKLDLELLKVFLTEYNKVRKLTKKEKELIYPYIRFTCYCYICWHLNKLINKKQPKKLMRANYFMRRLELLKKI